MRCGRRPNDVRIDCKAAKHGDGDRGAVLAPNRDGRAGTAPPTSTDCSSAATAARANKRRFVNLLQQLGGATPNWPRDCEADTHDYDPEHRDGRQYTDGIRNVNSKTR